MKKIALLSISGAALMLGATASLAQPVTVLSNDGSTVTTLEIRGAMFGKGSMGKTFPVYPSTEDTNVSGINPFPSSMKLGDQFDYTYKIINTNKISRVGAYIGGNMQSPSMAYVVVGSNPIYGSCMPSLDKTIVIGPVGCNVVVQNGVAIYSVDFDYNPPVKTSAGK